MGKNKRNQQKQKEKEKEKENQKQPNKAGTPAGCSRIQQQHTSIEAYKYEIYQQELAKLKEIIATVNHGKEQVVINSLSTSVQKLDMVLTLRQDNDEVNEILNKVLFVFMESLLKKTEEMEKQNELLKKKGDGID